MSQPQRRAAPCAESTRSRRCRGWARSTARGGRARERERGATRCTACGRRATHLAFPHFLRQPAAAPPVAGLGQLIRQVVDVYARPRAARRSRHDRHWRRRRRCSVNCGRAFGLTPRGSGEQSRAQQRCERARHESQPEGQAAHGLQAHVGSWKQAAPRPLSPRHGTARSCLRAIRDTWRRDASRWKPRTGTPVRVCDDVAFASSVCLGVSSGALRRGIIGRADAFMPARAPARTARCIQRRRSRGREGGCRTFKALAVVA